MRKRLALFFCLSLTASAWSAPVAERPSVTPGAAPSPSLALPSVSVPFASPALPAASAAQALAPAASEAAAAPAAAEQLARAGALLAPSQASPTGAPSQSAESGRAAEETFWSGARAETAVDALAPAEEASQPWSRLARFSRPKLASALAGAVVPLPAAKAALPDWAQHAWTQVAPYAWAGAGIGATYAAGRLSSWAVTTLGARWGWDQHRVVAVRLAVSTAGWIAGTTATLHAAGVSKEVLVTSLGLGGVTLTMAAKEFIRQVLEGLKVLVYRPFFPGDRIIVDKSLYKVRGFTLRYLELDRYKKSTSMMTYATLSGKPVTVLRRYTPAKDSSLPNPQGWRSSWTAMRGEARQNLSLRKATAWLAAGVAVLVGLPSLKAEVALPAFQWVFPWLEAGAIMFATRQADNWIYSFIGRIAEKAQWRPQTTMFVRLGAQMLVYVIGGTLAMHAMGVTWTTVAATVGVTSFVVGWATGDVIGNVIQGFLILYSKPFGVGDVIEVGGITGRVIDMNLQYVVLEHSDKTHSLIPYSVVRDSVFTVLDPSEADTRPPQPDPDTNTPPAARPQPRPISHIDALTKAWLTHSPFTIGDAIRVGSDQGEVVEINADHVVLEREDSTRVTIPFAALRDTGFSLMTAAASPGNK